MKKSLIVIFLVIFTLLLSGCWSKRELSDLAIVSALGIDKINDEYYISVQIVNAGEMSGSKSSGGQSPVATYHTTGKSLFEAVRKLTTTTPRRAYFTHMQLVVFGEEFASEGIAEALDFMARDQAIRSDFNFVVAYNSTAKDILSVLTPIEKLPAKKMLNSTLASQDAWGSTKFIDTEDLISELGGEHKSTVLSAIELVGDKEKGKGPDNVERIETSAVLHFIGFGVFKKDKLIGFLTESESIYYNFLMDNIKSTIINTSCPNKGSITTEIGKSKTTIHGKFENGIPKINVKIDIEQNVAEVKCNIDLSEEKTLKMIDKRTANYIKGNIEQTINTIKKDYQVDILNFGEVLHREDYQAWDTIKDDWSTIFPELEVNVDVNVHTFGTATLVNPIPQE
ncbi:Ger(x)C family spore germination protein [Lysinibacillus sp. fls2-241-R2A-57]|uniref:Ger(x)C family spore germination protein n=1 Tax=Lysinibacillus sp. fls2-241-R2A-57 TaxID=3040292 RepID=UPI002556E92D|nr:Ger(x)C family spore germination protein [Lysinibacillus sp. fls2-241-R2A-57]